MPLWVAQLSLLGHKEKKKEDMKMDEWGLCDRRRGRVGGRRGIR